MLAACAAGRPLPPPEGEPYVRGPVEEITHHATASRMLVRAGPASREPCGIQARVDGSTRFLRRGSAREPIRISIGEIAVGDTVEVFVSGPVAESCPVQGYASTIVRVGPS